MRHSKALPIQFVSNGGNDDEALKELARRFVDVIPRSMWSIRFGMREAAGEELTVPQFRTMAALTKQSRTNGELAERLGVSVPAMSRLVDGLVEMGYVVRIPQAHDRRQVLLELSLDGRRKFQKLRKHTHGRFLDKFSALDSTQKEQLMAGLGVLEELFP